VLLASFLDGWFFGRNIHFSVACFAKKQKTTPGGRESSSATMDRYTPSRPWRIIACLLAIAVTPVYAQTAPQGFYRPGPLDGITDVAGVRVAHVTKIAGNC